MSSSQSVHYKHLKSKWLKRHQRIQKKVWKKHAGALDWFKQTSQQFAAGSLASLLMFATPAASAASFVLRQVPQPTEVVIEKSAKTVTQLISDLKSALPTEVVPLSAEQENSIGQKLSEYFSMPISSELQGKRLNRSYGLIGAEQHLMRYPGDVVENMAPGRGAWGYFASSSESMTQKDIDREKYYLAVQTFLSPGWNENPNELYNFFKYRKMIAVNPENGKAMVVVIGDAGPAEFTGKHLGGSPEVMNYLERVDGGGKGPVLYFFIDDPDDKIPLGPVSIKP